MSDINVKESRNTLLLCCGAHIIQDGLVALQYVLLPILAQAFGLSYSQVGLLRALSNSAMSLLEIPSGILAERYGERRLLILGLVAAGLGYLGVAFSSSFLAIALFFIITGAGAGFQHSLTSAILVKTFAAHKKRKALGTYNASGDAGKLTFTGLFGVAVGAGLAWNTVVILLSLVAIVFAFTILKLLPEAKGESAGESSPASQSGYIERWGIKRPRQFAMLGTVVFLDCAVQSVFLTFLAFVLLQKGASAPVASFAVVLALSGGMTGKFCCGFLTTRYGDFKPFIFIQFATIVGIIAVILMPVSAVLIALPLVGLVVQGSSTITYGVISDQIKTSHQSRGFALIYTLGNIASVVAPFAFGLLADFSGLETALWMLCLLIGLSMPAALFLRDPLQLNKEAPR